MIGRKKLWHADVRAVGYQKSEHFGAYIYKTVYAVAEKSKLSDSNEEMKHFADTSVVFQKFSDIYEKLILPFSPCFNTFDNLQICSGFKVTFLSMSMNQC